MLQRIGTVCRPGLVMPKHSSVYRSTMRSLSDVKTMTETEPNEPVKFRLRDYQQEAVDTCIEHVTKDKVKRIGVSLATGGGKTVIFANLVHELNQLHAEKAKKDILLKKKFRTLILVHRRELAFQALEKVKNFNPDSNVELEMGKDHADVEFSDTIIASVMSLHRRLDNYKPDDIDLIIVDEAHHIIANTYMTILRHFNADVPETKVPVIGFSATFERADKRALSNALDEIVYHKDVMEMIDEKWLCEGRFTNVKISANLDDVKRTRSDFILNSLSSVINTPETNNIVVKTYLNIKKQFNIKSSLVFGVDKAHVNALNEAFLADGVKSECITSDFNATDRDRIMQSFKNGETEVLVNCGILTEGTDIPNIDCILICRPTCSRPLFVQMIGRGLRLHKGKKHCHIVDFVNASSVGVVSVPTLFGIPDFKEPMNDMKLSEIEALKKQAKEKEEEAKRLVEEKEKETKRLMEENKKEEVEESAAKLVERQKEEKLRQETLAREYQDYIKIAEVSLVSYDSFRDYYLEKNRKLFSTLLTKKKPQIFAFDYQSEALQFKKSKYQWTLVAADSWALSLNSRYFKIDRTTDQNKYVLKLYTEVNFESDYNGKWLTKGKPFVNNLPAIMMEVDEIIGAIEKENSRFDSKFHRRIPVTSYSKNASWRRQPISPKQSYYLTTKLTDVLAKNKKEFPFVNNDIIKEFLKTIRKGPAADLTFATTIAPVYPVKSLLKLLNLGATIGSDLLP